MSAIGFPNLWIPRSRKIITDVLEMAHLMKKSGHLAKSSSGHLVKCSPPAPCSGCAVTPSKMVVSISTYTDCMNTCRFSGAVSQKFTGSLPTFGPWDVPQRADIGGACFYYVSIPFTGLVTNIYAGTTCAGTPTSYTAVSVDIQVNITATTLQVSAEVLFGGGGAGENGGLGDGTLTGLSSGSPCTDSHDVPNDSLDTAGPCVYRHSPIVDAILTVTPG